MVPAIIILSSENNVGRFSFIRTTVTCGSNSEGHSPAILSRQSITFSKEVIHQIH
jgi:hypothetical protein